jgi:outer membrane protein TolC
MSQQFACKLLIILAAFSSLVEASEPSQTESLSLNQAIEMAIANNQGLAQARAEADAFSAIPSQEAALPDPVLGLNALNLPTDTFDLDQEPMTQMQISLSQKFPFPGRRGLQNDAAEKDASAAVSHISEQRHQLVSKVRAAWWQIAYLDHALEIIQQNQDLMRDFIEIAQTKYKVGKGLQQDVLLAQLELSKLFNRQLPLGGMRDAAAAELNALMDRAPDRPISIDHGSLNTSLKELPPEADLIAVALDARPLLDVQRDKMEAARLRVDVAQKKSYPDFTLGAAYGFRDATDPTGRDLPDVVTFRLGFNLPIYSGSKQDKEVEQRNSNYFGRKYAFNDSLRAVQADVAKNYARYHASRDQVALYNTVIIPQARQTVSAMLSGYQVNKVDFLNVINAQLALYNAQIDYWEALSKAKQSLALLAAAIGSEELYE